MSFSSNYLKLREQRLGRKTSSTGGTTPPVPSETKSSGDSFSDNYLALREKRNNMTISERAEKRAQALQKKQWEQDGTQTGILRNAFGGHTGPTTSGGYYSRRDLGAQSEKLYGNVAALEATLKEKRTALDTAQASLKQAETGLRAAQGYLEQARAAYDADPTEARANSYNQIAGTYSQAYNEYSGAYEAYAKAYGEYKPHEDELVNALAFYQVYNNQQQAAFDDWRGTIRDEAAIQKEIEAIDQQIADLEVAEATAAEASRQQQLAEYQARQDAKPWYEKLAGYLGGAQDTTLPLAGVTPGTVDEALSQTQQSVSEEMQALLDAKELLQEEYDWSRYYRYADLMQAADFAEKSRYVTTANGREPVLNNWSGIYTETGFDDLTYDYINRNEEAMGKAMVNSIGSNTALLGLDKSYLEKMTDEEISIFNYLYATQGADAAYQYTAYLTSDLTKRQRMEQEARWAAWAEEDPVGSSVFSVLMSPMKSISYLGQFADYTADGQIDQNAAYNKFSYIPGSIRGQVVKEIEKSGKWGPVGSFAYQTGMSMADFLLTTAISGGNQGLSLAIMGTGAAADATIAAKDRGLNDDQAFSLGTIAGLAEVITEKVSLETLLNPDILKNGTWKYIVKNALAEGSEEVGSDIINLLADVLISKDQNEWLESMRSYIYKGKTEGEAFGLVLADQAAALGLDFLGGALSGGIMGSAGAVAYNADTKKLGAELETLDLSEADVRAFIESGLESDPETASYQIATEMQKKIDAGKKLSSRDLSRLYQANVQAQPDAGWDKKPEPENVSLPTLDDEADTGEVSASTLLAQAKADLAAEKITDAKFDEIVDEVMHLEELEDGTSVKTFDTGTGTNVQPDNIDVNVNGGTQNGNEQLQGLRLGATFEEQTTGPAAAQPARGDYAAGGNSLLPGGSQRYDGAGAGEQAGSLAGRTGQATQGNQARANAARASVQRTNLGKNLRLEKISSIDLGLQAGTDTKRVQIIPQEYWDDSMAAKAEQVYQETGKPVSYILGGIEFRNARGTVSTAKGVITEDQIIVQANHSAYTPEQIADHEAYHGMRDFYGQGLSDEIAELIRDEFSREEFDRVLDKYIEALSGIYDLNGARDGAEYEQRVNGIIEELLADAHAGMNMWGAGATKFTDTVNRYLDDNHISRKSEQDNGTEESTGPPFERFSHEDQSSIKQQLVAASNALNGMDPVANITISANVLAMDKAQKQEWVINKLRPTGYSVNRRGLGLIEFAQKRLKSAFNYFRRNSAEEAVFEALPNVLRDGIEIGGHMDHKGRSYGTVTIAAPIIVNGARGNMAVVVKRTTGNYYKVHRVLSPDGAEFILETKEEAAPTSGGGVTNNGSLAAPISSASGDIITDRNSGVKERFSHAGENANNADLEALARAKERMREILDSVPPNVAEQFQEISANSVFEPDEAYLAGELSAGPYGELFDEYKDLLEEVEVLSEDLSSAYDPYRNTAGENEARDVAQRKEFNAQQRRETIPSRGDDRTVFAETNRYDDAGGLIPLSQRYDESKKDIRYSMDDGGQDPAQQKPATPKKKIRPVAESRPLIAKKDLRNTVLNLFSIPSEQRSDLGTMIDSYADRLIKNGSLTEEDRKTFFDRMYDAGVMVVPAEEYSAFTRSHIVDGRIYVSDSVKADFGDDWADIRRRAFAAGVYLVNDKSASGIDQWNATLSAEDMLPGLFDSEETDERTILERIVQVAEEGKDEHLSLAEYTRRLSQQEGISEDELLDNMERQLDWALRTFAEKARLEVHLRDRTGQKIAQEREKGNQRMARQYLKEAQRRADERQARKDSARRAKERRELRELQQKTLKQLQWLSRNRNRAPEERKATWDEVLGDIDLYAVGAANEMRWSEKHNATWKDLAQMYKDAMKNDPNFLPSKELERIVARLDGTKIAEMDVGALQDLYKAAIGLRTEFYNRNNVINDEMQRLFAEVYTDAKREIEAAPGGYTGNAADKFVNLDQLTPMNVLQRMGGWDPNGAFYSMAKQLEKGERDIRAYSVKAQKMLQDFLTKHEDWVKKADGQGKDAIWYEVEVPQLLELGMGDKPIFGPTVKVYMTPAQKVHMYLESKNLDNLRHMTGGRTFVDKELYSRGKRQEALAQGKTVRLAPETVKAIVSDLTAEEMELAQILDKYYNTFATQEINRVSNILYGYDKAMGKNYAPIYTNRNYTKTEFGVFDTTAEGVGNLKGRQYAVNPSYNISAFDAFERHVDQTARFVGMAIPARNWTTLMNWREKNNSTGDVITHKWGEESKKYITDLITTLQGGDDAKSDTVSSGLSKLQSNYISAIFGANPSIVLKQLGSIPLAAAYLDARNAPTLAQIARIDRGLISKYTQDLEWRTMGYATPETKQLKDNPNWTQTNKAFKFAFGGGAITAMDGWAASTLWPWAENKVRREFPELEVGTRAQVNNGESPFYKKVAEEFEDALARSQSTSDEIHQGRLRKSKNPITRAFTMFRSDSAQTYNTLRQKIGEAQYYARTGAKPKVLKMSKKAAGAAFVAMLLNALWSESVNFLMALWKNKGKYYRDDEDELTFESVAGEMASGMVGSFAGTVTGGEELLELIGNIITGDTWYGIETPGMEQLNDLLETILESGGGMRDLITDAADILKNGGDLGDYFSKHSGDILGSIKDVAEAAAMYLPGLPAGNLEAYLVGALKWISPELGTAYDDMFSDAGKNDLSGLEGNALVSRVGGILDDHKASESEETAQALAALYEAGYKKAVPSDTPSSVSINGEKQDLGAYQQQAYNTIWGGIVANALDELVSLDGFAEAKPKTQEKMLSYLYDYANEMTKAELFDDYEPDTRDEAVAAFDSVELTMADFLYAYGKYSEINSTDLKAGEKALEFSYWVDEQRYTPEQAATVKNELAYFTMAPASSGKYDKLVDAGMDPDEAYDLSGALDELQPEVGKIKVSDLQRWRVCVDFSDDVEDQLTALFAVMNDTQFRKVEIANDFGVSPDSYVTLQEIKLRFDLDGNGSYANAEIQAAIDGMPGYYTTEQKAALWQLVTGSTSAKSNPYSREVGQRVLDAKVAKKTEDEEDELPGLTLGNW